MGSIYESLLELHPKLNVKEGLFELASASGNERKTTGSYYTPATLVTCLLASALDPVLDEAAKKTEPERAILALRVVDPACGSGHFLIAAAHRIAKRLAFIRTGSEEPSPVDVRKALRDVIGHCIYGVDLNEMAVELCKVSLWMEALDPGKPLSFLDSKIRHGNALIGTTPGLIAQGIPDDAFEVIEGDDKKVVAALKKRNKAERAGQGDLFRGKSVESAEQLTRAALALDELVDETIEGLHGKERAWQDLVRSELFQHAQRVANAWCAAFVWNKIDSESAITENIFRRLANGEVAPSVPMMKEVDRLSATFGFFHWHLSFPDVFRATRGKAGTASAWEGGFDVFLGNPPWDELTPSPKEFFATYDPQVRFQDAAGEKRIVARLLEDVAIARMWRESCRALHCQLHFFKRSGRFELFAPGNLGKGDFNVYRMFVETGLRSVRADGVVAQYLPEAFYNAGSAMALRRELLDKFRWESLRGFENTREIWFKGVHSAAKFCLYVAQRGGHTDSILMAFGLRSHGRLAEVSAGVMLRVPVALLRKFSPDALAVMEFHSQTDVEIANKMYESAPSLGDPNAGPPTRYFVSELHMTADRESFNEDPQNLPLYEGRMIDAFDHRAKAYRSGRGRAADWVELPFGAATKKITPQWFISQDDLPEKLGNRHSRYRVGFCNVTGPGNERTLLAALVPPGTVCGNAVTTLTFEEGFEWAYMIWLAIANSFAMDFLVRKKVSLHVSNAILDSLPFPRLARTDSRTRRIVELAARLTCCGEEMHPYWLALAKGGFVPASGADAAQPAGLITSEGREQARDELDALVALTLFNLTREDLFHVLHAFPIVERRDIERCGAFRTLNSVLAFYDAIASRQVRRPDTVVVRVNPVAGDATVLPFKRVTPRSEDKYRSCLPLYSLKPAAGDFSDFQEAHAEAWVELGSQASIQKGQFVAQVVGKSMEPLIPDGSYCVFQRPWLKPKHGDVGLFKLNDAFDPETGGRFTVKRLNSRRVVERGEPRMVGSLMPENPDFAPIVVEEGQEEAIQPVALLVAPLSGSTP